MIERILDKLTLWCMRIACVILCIICVVAFANVVGRIFNRPVKGTVEIVSYGMFVTMCLALARTGFAGRHVRVSIIVDNMPRVANAVVLCIDMLIAALTFGIVVYLCFGYIPDAVISGRVTDVYKVPYYFVYIFLIWGMFLSGITFLFRAVDSIINVFREQRHKSERLEIS